MKPDDDKRVRRFAPKTRSGCRTCKSRHVRCDEQKPICQTCKRIGIRCLGYNEPELLVSRSVDKENPEAADKTETAATTEQGRESSCSLQPERVLIDSHIYRSLQPISEEPAVITQAYTRLTSHVWDDIYYQSPERAFSFRADDGTFPWLVTADARSYSSMGHHSYLAVAASALVLFQPDRYPVQLHFKYLHLAVAEIRRSIAQNRSSPHELLYSIAQILLASVVHHDVDPGRAHLAAAMSLLVQLGGIKAVSPQVAILLGYANIRLATVMLRSPLSPLSDAFQDPSNAQLMSLPADSILSQLAARVRADTNTASIALPSVAAQGVHDLMDTVLALARVIYQGPNIAKLGTVSTSIAVTMSRILQERPNIVSKPWKSDKRSSQTPPQRDASTQRPSLDDWTVVLVMWIQILYCCTNAPLGAVSIRTAVLPLLPRLADGSTDVTRAGLSQLVQEGLHEWNERATGTQHTTTTTRDSNADDWPSLVNLVANMEREFPVRVAPVMRRLLVVCAAGSSMSADRHGRHRWDIVNESGQIGKTFYL